MYSAVLVLHSLSRYAVLVLALVVIARAAMGLRGQRPFEPTDRKLGGAFLGTVHLQVILGLLLNLGLSPITKAAYSQMPAAMRDKTLRFWAVEHLTMGLLVALIATITRVKSRKAESDPDKHRIALIGYSVTLLVILAMIPWPFRTVIGRGWLPSFGG
ncbi:MAG: hypothetical protein Q8Q09_17060 [Deltaproteobacteria bacterium]|nr:hypothetical protein [Deltaproteobacteria bacterium]